MKDSRPEQLAELLDTLALLGREERIDALISVADGFREVPSDVAERPFPEDRRVPACESEAFVWAVDRDDGTCDFHFAVENPQGISAKAMAALLGRMFSGRPLEEVAALDESLIDEVFGEGLSARKSLGLGGMIGMVRSAARARLVRGAAPSERSPLG